MIDILDASARVLAEARFQTTSARVGPRDVLAIEDATSLGFVFVYDDSDSLITNWQSDADAAVSNYQFGMRKAGLKAWNTYIILLAAGAADLAQTVALGAIEEDLRGTRKIARAGVTNISELHAALLPLLPIQSAPRLEGVDFLSEIRDRTTELPTRAVDAFLSATDESVVINVLEESA